MGNAALCQSCHANKSVRAQGNMLELDATPDYYGCNSDHAKEPVFRVSVRPQMGKMLGYGSKNQQWCSLVESLHFLEGS